ncbi:MAG: single-stranded DNA-binding protein [candidate division Zixibacteria bacterium SM23_73]|nr:MAG: single-stranded DNA-binding protein [candidate division Zixibacteria bacterium SM23_73]
MRGVNKVILIGNLGRDPELRYLPSGQAVVKFTLATGAKWKDKNGQLQERTDWHNIVAFGRQGEVCNEYLKKGSPVYVEGRIQTRSWEDKDGNKKYMTEIVAQSINLLGRKGEPEEEVPEEVGETKTEDEDLPF